MVPMAIMPFADVSCARRTAVIILPAAKNQSLKPELKYECISRMLLLHKTGGLMKNSTPWYKTKWRRQGNT